MWRVEAYQSGRSVATDQLRELGESLMPVATAIADATTVEWVKTAQHAKREGTLGGGGI
jgi:hypothetical protein